MNKIENPVIKVGIMTGMEIAFRLNGTYRNFHTGELLYDDQRVWIQKGVLWFQGMPCENNLLIIEPLDPANCSFDLFDVTIGIEFHWERKEDQRFRGSLLFMPEDAMVRAINILSVEEYLISVISSEMSATSSLELLKAHAIISRSWLLAQVVKAGELQETKVHYETRYEIDGGYIRWYDREDHHNFDVCADDHCQRYQGITRQTSPLVEQAVRETEGVVLTYDGKICDARFSKSCGGVSENFELAWEPVPHHYLQAIADVDNRHSFPDLTIEKIAEEWIRTSPESFCNTRDERVLSQVLNNYDQETPDFYRWKVRYKQEELASLIRKKSGIDFGDILQLQPLRRGKSGRIIQLRIVGTRLSLIIGKELEIRKILSPSHLYSSAFVVDRVLTDSDIPDEFILTGAGWGHGVGLCQIGAAMMGEKGYNHQQILSHYFMDAGCEKIF